MGVFNGIEIMFFFLGVLSTLGVLGILMVIKKFNAKWPVIALLSMGVSLILFSFAWSVSSILEKEHQAANMGLLFFGLPGIIFMGMAWKKLSQKPIVKMETQ